MSLLKLKSKTEPLYTSKKITTYNDENNEETKDTISPL